MKKLLPYSLALCFVFPFFARSCPDPADICHGPADTTIYIKKDTTLNRYPAIRVEWQLLINGVIAQKGVIPVLPLSSKHPTALHLPARLPAGNAEAILRLVYRRPSSGGGKARLAPLLTRLIPVRSWGGDYAIPPVGDLTFTDTNDVFTITSATAFFQFDKQTGWLLRYEANHLLLMGDPAGLRSALWPPATTAPHLQLFSTSTGSQLVIVRAEYTLPEVSSLLHMSYTINAAGDMLVGQSVEPDTARQEADSTKRQPVLPRFGMDWILPAGLDSIRWYGPPSWITLSPISASSPAADTDARNTDFTGVRWWTITGSDGKGMRITADSAFLHLHLTGQQLGIDRPMTPDPLPDGNFQYAYKVSPIMPAPANSSRTPAPAKRF